MFLKASVSNMGVKVFTVLSQLILAIFTNRILGPEGRGIIGTLSYWNALYFTIGYLSINLAIYNLNANKKATIEELAGSSMLTGLILGVLVVLLGVLFYVIFPGWFNNLPFHFYVLVLITVPFLILQNYLMAILQVAGQITLYNLTFLLSACTNVIFCAIALFGGFYNVTVATGILVANNILNFIITLFLLNKYQRIRFRVNYSILKEIIRVGIIAHLATLVTFLSNKSDVLMINSMLGEKEAGIYYLAVMMGGFLLFIPQSVQAVLYTQVADYLKSGSSDHILKICRLTFVFTLIAALVIIIFSPYFVGILGGEKFSEAVPILRIYCVGAVLLTPSVTLAAVWTCMGVFRQLNIASFMIVLVIFISNILLLKLIGAKGAAITFCIVSILSLCIHLFFVRKYLKKANVLDALILKSGDITHVKDVVFSMLKRNK